MQGRRAGGAQQIKKIKALPCLFIGLFMGVRILERLSSLLMGTGYSISLLHVEFYWLDSSSQLLAFLFFSLLPLFLSFLFFKTARNAHGAFLIETRVRL